ncbi:hypothetical protein HF292_009670 [Acidithiobacillus ferruginosus]|uniref:Uncharacterized protein n=1 Tax=Acidithiobacillus ferruginosus TaxID=3063951 RepID=A0ACD5IE31_9PROT|nr:hypothetical protein [Acidithiobacillus ferruginosus]MBU2813549.1 hypothetical protein [Acidithiobacillus ferruginosus]
MANLQHIADRIFRHVEAGHLAAGYALTMGALIDVYDADHDFHAWVDVVPSSAVEKLLVCMVRAGTWEDPGWLAAWIKR